MGIEFWTIVISIVLSVTCALAGVLLVAKKEALISEGLSHAVLPGIIIAYLFLRDQQSPILILSAAASGYLMIVLMQLLKKTKLIQSDAALGVTFSTLFSIGIILASQYLKNSPIHAHCIIDGNLASAPFNRFELYGYDLGPKAFVIMLINLILLLGFLGLCYKELKMMVFDPVLARSLGYRPELLHSIWLAMVSVISVSAFESAGAVLVVALLIAPAATAFLLTKKLHWVFAYSALCGTIAAVGGYYLGIYLDVSPTGPIASITGMMFVFALLFAPVGGVLSSVFRKAATQRRILADSLLLRIQQQNKAGSGKSIGWEELSDQMGIPRRVREQIFHDLEKRGVIKGPRTDIQITDTGREFQSSLTVES